MTYGNKAVVLVEIGLTTLRTSTYDEQQNEEQLRLNLDLIDEVRETNRRRLPHLWNAEHLRKYYP